MKTVLDEFASLSGVFALGELYASTHLSTNSEVLREVLLTDGRFVELTHQRGMEGLFISKSILFSWYANFTLRLADAKKTRLSVRQTANALSFLRVDEWWDDVPQEAIVFGSRFGFVAPSFSPDHYVFPLARILSSLSETERRAVRPFLTRLGEEPRYREAMEMPLQSWLNEGFLPFDKRDPRIRTVVERREGLATGKRETLQQLAQSIEVTRERVRQIEAKFWKRLAEHPQMRMPFIKGLLCAMIRRSGSLLVDLGTCYELRFLAKCTGVPVGKTPNVDMLILSASPDDTTSVNHSDSWQDGIDPSRIARILESEAGLCLPLSDMELLSGRLAAYNRAHLTKAQKVYLALRALGEPAHYSMVTQMHNDMFLDEQVTERNVHAILGRGQDGIVWVGSKGVFALREWGYERPSQTLFDSVTDVVRRKYCETSRPVPFNVILAEVAKARPTLNRNSLVIALGLNPQLYPASKDTFVPRDTVSNSQLEYSADALDKILREFWEEQRS